MDIFYFDSNSVTTSKATLRYAAIVCVVTLVAISSVEVAAQGVLRSDDEIAALAEQYMIDFADMNRQRRDAKYACVARGEDWRLSRNTGEETLYDMVVIRLVDKTNAIDHSLWSWADDYGLSRSRGWDQRFILNDKTFRRFGDGDSGDWFSHDVPTFRGFVQDVKMEYPIFEPFLCVLASLGGMLNNRVTDEYVETHFRKFVGGTTDRQNRIVGIWTYGSRPGAVVDITFSSDPPHLPVSLVERLKNSGDDEVTVENRELFGTSQINQITWGKHVSGVPVPLRLEIGEYVPVAGLVLSEVTLEFEWKLGDEVKVQVPTQEQLLNTAKDKFDWRTSLKTLFDDDFYSSYKEWKANRESPKVKKQ